MQNNVHKNNDFIAPTSVSNIPLSNSNLPVDDLVIKNVNNYTVGSGIPRNFYANTSLISTNMGQYERSG